MIKIGCLIFMGTLIILGIIGIIATKKSLKRDREQFEKWLEENKKE